MQAGKEGGKEEGESRMKLPCLHRESDGAYSSERGLRREAAGRNVATPEGIQVPSESLGLSIIGHSRM